MTRIKNQESRIKGFLRAVFSMILNSLFIIQPVYAQSPVPIGEHFGFGDFKSLGEATNTLVDPGFAIAATLVVIYFLWGAFKYLQAGETKEDVSEAKQMISHAIAGFIILMFAFLILKLILSSVFKFGIGFFQ